MLELITERPVGHGSGAADESGVLFHHQLRRGPGEEVEIENPSDHFVGDPVAGVNNIHAIAIQQQNAMGDSIRPHIHVKRVRSVQIQIDVGAGDVGVPKGQSLIRLNLERALRVLPNAVKIGFLRRKRRRELEILVLEDEVGRGLIEYRGRVEEGVVGGAAADGEPERGGVPEGEDEVGTGVGETRRRAAAAARLGPPMAAGAGENVVGDFPAGFVGISYRHSQTVFRF